jgi:enamine deaminase RidA (YjgF/YER057c/UK114 family)
MGEVFGEIGAHARAAVGCVSLPLGVAVEVEGIFQISA